MVLISYITLAWLSHIVFAELAVRKTISLFSDFIWKLFRNNKQLYNAILIQCNFFSQKSMAVQHYSSHFQPSNLVLRHSQKIQAFTTLYQTLWEITKLYKQRNSTLLYVSNISVEINQIRLDCLLPSNSPPACRRKWKLCHVEYKSTREKKTHETEDMTSPKSWE